MKTRRLEMVQWGLGLFTLVTALAVWWGHRQPLEQTLSAYEFFPLLGLIAFGLMWTHFIGGMLRRFWGVREDSPSRYHAVSMAVVLGCILLHPLILWIVLWRDDFGLPPLSQYEAYGGTLLLNAALLAATVALAAFLAYELKRWLSGRTWWRYIEHVQIVAMALIFFHALTLGGELGVGWYAALWWLYGATLVAATLVSYMYDRQFAKEVHNGDKTK